MKKTRLLGAVVVFGLLAFTAKAQINTPLNLALVGQVQQDQTGGPPASGVLYQVVATTTNVTINTKSLLKLIAADQGFTLPPQARLWPSGNTFFILNQNNTIFTNIDSEVLSLTYVTNVLEFQTIQTTNHHYASTITEPLVAVLTYNGSSISFTLNCYGKYHFYNATDSTNAILVISFSGQCFGSGTCGDRNMVIKGSLSGKRTERYHVGGGGGPGTFPGPGGRGSFPGGFPVLPPPPLGAPGTPSSGGSGIIAPGVLGVFPR
jgi:hypothetical protein